MVAPVYTHLNIFEFIDVLSDSTVRHIGGARYSGNASVQGLKCSKVSAVQLELCDKDPTPENTACPIDTPTVPPNCLCND
jgi:hypothetical protein